LKSQKDAELNISINLFIVFWVIGIVWMSDDFERSGHNFNFEVLKLGFNFFNNAKLCLF